MYIYIYIYIYVYIYLYIFIYNSAHRITIHWNTTHKVTVIYELCVLPTSTRRKMITCIVTMSAIILEHHSILHSWRESCESIFSRRVASEVEEASGATKQLTQKKSV